MSWKKKSDRMKNTFQTIMKIAENVLVNFFHSNSIWTVLGFDALVYGVGRHLSQHTVNIMRVNSVFSHKRNWINIC